MLYWERVDCAVTGAIDTRFPHQPAKAVHLWDTGVGSAVVICWKDEGRVTLVELAHDKTFRSASNHGAWTNCPVDLPLPEARKKHVHCYDFHGKKDEISAVFRRGKENGLVLDSLKGSVTNTREGNIEKWLEGYAMNDDLIGGGEDESRKFGEMLYTFIKFPDGE